MSVIQSKRGASNMEFLYNARKLQIFSIRKCVSFPKKYTFYVSQPIANISTRIHEYVKLANGIYPTNNHEYQLRRDYFLKAYSELGNISSQIEIAEALFGVNADDMREWSCLINTEARLIKAILKTDKERFKELKG